MLSIRLIILLLIEDRSKKGGRSGKILIKVYREKLTNAPQELECQNRESGLNFGGDTVWKRYAAAPKVGVFLGLLLAPELVSRRSAVGQIRSWKGALTSFWIDLSRAKRYI
jgi:hypothetical protein